MNYSSKTLDYFPNSFSRHLGECGPPCHTYATVGSHARVQIMSAAPRCRKKEEVMNETSSNREKAEKAFRDWHDGTGSITDLLADDLRWTIVGRSQAAKTYDSKEQFVGEVLRPFGARFSQPFRPVAVRGVYADGDTVVVVWDGEGTRLDGKPYENTYAWFMRFREGRVVEATAFFDSIAFDELWSEVTPTN